MCMCVCFVGVVSVHVRVSAITRYIPPGHMSLVVFFSKRYVHFTNQEREELRRESELTLSTTNKALRHVRACVVCACAFLSVRANIVICATFVGTRVDARGAALSIHTPHPTVYFLFITEKATAAPTTTASPTIATNLPPPDAFPFPVPGEGFGTAPKEISWEL